MSETWPNVYVVEYVTESGDRGVVGYFPEYPTDGHLTAWFKENMPSEFVTEDGVELRYVFWDVHELEPLDMPKPVTPVETI